MKNRYSVEQIIRILGEIERAGLKISDACRPHGISEQSYYRWRNKYGGMEISEAWRRRGAVAAGADTRRGLYPWGVCHS